jgi:hypothetical protein
MKKYFTFILIISLCGCELIVDVDIPVEKRAIVLNSFFNPDSTWKAKVSLNRHILDNDPYPIITNALVIISDGDTPIDTLKPDLLGYYRSDNGRPQAGRNYTVKAVTSQYGEASSTSLCPQPVVASFSGLQKTLTSNGQPEYAVKIYFKDEPGLNFYQISAIGEYSFTNPNTGQGFLNRSDLYVWSDDDGIDDEEIPNNEGFFFPDALFDGQNFSVNVKMRPNMWGGSAKTTFYIYFRSLSVDYYKYKVTSLLQNYTSGDPFAQPVKVFSNIENGSGIFGGYSQSVVVIEE